MNGYYRQCPADHYEYIIQPGDTLGSIASRLEVSVTRIMQANPGLNPYNLLIGQRICIPACPPNHTSRVIQPGDTLYQISQQYRASIESILAANPSIDPNDLRVGQRICIPSACISELAVYQDIIEAMQSDINMLKAESPVQQAHQANYGASTQTTQAVLVNDRQLRFEAVPVTFEGNFKGHYSVGVDYPYYLEAAMGGRRSISVEDNFGLWHTFNYRENIG
jgi:LysM repeat protein